MSDYDLIILSKEIKIYYVHGLTYLLYLGERPLQHTQSHTSPLVEWTRPQVMGDTPVEARPPYFGVSQIVTNIGSDMTLEQIAATNTEFGLSGSSAVVKFDGRTIFELKPDELLVIEQPKEVSSLLPNMTDHAINWNGEMTLYTKKCDGFLCLMSDLLPKKHLIILRHKKT